MPRDNIGALWGDAMGSTSSRAPKLSFDARDLAAQVEALDEADIDALPFGAVRLDRNFFVRFYNATESKLSGYGHPIGQNFFEISETPTKDELKAKILAARETGKVDLELGWRGGKGASLSELRLRVQSSKDGGVWMFFERD